MVLAAADSTLEGMLSLNVNVIEEGADASSSQSCALVMVGGAGTVHHGGMRSSVKSQASVRAYRQRGNIRHTSDASGNIINDI